MGLNLIACAAVLLAVVVRNADSQTTGVDVEVIVPNGHTWNIQCNGGTNKISVQYAKYISEKKTVKKKSSCKRCQRNSPLFCDDTCVLEAIKLQCQAKDKCTVKSEDPSDNQDCLSRALKIKYSCIKNPSKSTKGCPATSSGDSSAIPYTGLSNAEWTDACGDAVKCCSKMVSETKSDCTTSYCNSCCKKLLILERSDEGLSNPKGPGKYSQGKCNNNMGAAGCMCKK